MHREHWIAPSVADLGCKIYEERIREEVELEHDGKASSWTAPPAAT